MTREERRAVVDRLLAAAAAGDACGMGTNYTDDVVVEFPFADPPARMEGTNAVVQRLTAAFEVFRISVTPDIVHHVDDSTVIVEAHGTGVHLPTGQPYANRYVIVYSFRDGLVCGQREYFNPMAARKAMN